MMLQAMLTADKKRFRDISPIVIIVCIAAIALPIFVNSRYGELEYLWLTYVIPVFFASLYFGFRGGVGVITLLTIFIFGLELASSPEQDQVRFLTHNFVVLFSIVGCCLGTSILSSQLGSNQKQLISTKNELLNLVKNLEVLLETATVLNSSVTLSTVLSKADKLVIDSLGLIPGIFLYDKNSDKLQLSCSSIFQPAEQANIVYSLGNGIPGRAAMQVKPYYVAKLIKDTEASPMEQERFKDRSALAINMFNKGALVGVMVFWAEADKQYTDQEINLLQGIVSQLGLAITNAQLYEQLQHLSTIDELTGLYNHRYFQERLEEELKRAQRKHATVNLLMVDIDHFKHYNDTFGHPAGDRLLKQVAMILKASVRDVDTVARYGGEEFTVILVDTSPDECAEISERIRRDIENFPFEGRDEQPGGRLTISMGVASFPRNATSRQDLIWLADQALYRVKHSTRNNVLVYSSVLDELKASLQPDEQDIINQLQSQLSIINAKDKYTFSHAERVVSYAEVIARQMRLSEEELRFLRYGAFLHDIGKIDLDRRILNKRDVLTAAELKEIRLHSKKGARLLEQSPVLASLIPMVRHHHERYDGAGYPLGLKGEEIPLAARILAVADSFDAMTVNRPYKPAKSRGEALKEVRQQAGKQFDPLVVEKFLEVMSLRDLQVS